MFANRVKKLLNIGLGLLTILGLPEHDATAPARQVWNDADGTKRDPPGTSAQGMFLAGVSKELKDIATCSGIPGGFSKMEGMGRWYIFDVLDESLRKELWQNAKQSRVNLEELMARPSRHFEQDRKASPEALKMRKKLAGEILKTSDKLRDAMNGVVESEGSPPAEAKTGYKRKWSCYSDENEAGDDEEEFSQIEKRVKRYLGRGEAE